MQWGCSGRSRCRCKKVNSHSVLSKYGWWGPLPLVQKGQPMQWVTEWMKWGHSGHSRCWCKKVNSQIWVVGTVTFSAKRSTHAVSSPASVDRAPHHSLKDKYFKCWSSFVRCHVVCNYGSHYQKHNYDYHGSVVQNRDLQQTPRTGSIFNLNMLSAILADLLDFSHCQKS